MPRDTDPTFEALLPHCETVSTVEISLHTGDLYRYCTGGESVNIGGDDYEPYLLGVGELKETENATSRVSVSISNVDNPDDWGVKVAAANRPLEMGKCIIRRLYIDADNPATTFHKHFFSGKMVGAQRDSSGVAVNFDVIPKTTASGNSIAIETLSPHNGWIFPEAPFQAPPGTGGNSGGTVGGGYCFTGETLVVLADGREIAFAELYERRAEFIGQMAKSFDGEMQIQSGEILNIFKSTGYAIIEVEFEDAAEPLRMKLRHRFFTEKREFVPMYKLIEGDRTFSHETDWTLSRIKKMTYAPHAKGVEVFNLTVRDFHTYFVKTRGGTAKAVHNAKDPREVVI